MKKILSILLTVLLIASSVPLAALQSSAATNISLNTTVSVNCRSAGNWDVRKFTPSESGTYIFSSSGSLDTLGYIALAEGEAENQNICDDGGAGENFAVTLKMTAGTTYYLGSTVISGSVGTYTVKIVKFEVDDGTVKPLTISSTTSVTSSSSKGQRFYSCTPSTSGKYIFISTGSYDALGYVFDEQWRQIAYAADGGGAQNFRITLDLQAGKTYYFGYATTSPSEVSFNILLYLSTYIKSVSLVNAPVKTSYLKGVDAKNISGTSAYHVDLNLSGFEFKINYSNGTTATKSYNSAASLRGLSCETSRTLNSGDNVVVFSYMGNSSSFTVSVIDTPVKSLEIAQMPDKTIYYDEDAVRDLDGNMVFHISLSGLVLKVNYKDGTSSNLILNSEYGEEIEYFYFDYTIPSGELVLGNNTMTLTYYGVSLNFNIKYSLNSDNWEYSVVDNSYVELTKYIGTDKQAVIPETLGGYDVTSIGANCFRGNSELTSVRITDMITNIGDNAFYQCSSIEELTLPKDLTSVGVNAFFGMTGVKKLNWNSENLTYLRASNVFGYLGNDAENGVTVEFGFDCKSIPENAFYMSSTTYNTNVTKVIVGENVSSIGNNAFRECVNLKEVIWNATEITNTIGAANNIWYNCAPSGSFTVSFGEYVLSIPSHLFYSTNASRAPRVSTFTVNGKKTSVTAGAFVNNTALNVTYYCWYDKDSALSSAYDYCISAGYDYVLMDSPLKDIYVYSPASKTEYMFGEELDLTGLVVYAEYEDGTQIDVTGELVASGFDSRKEGEQTLTLTYTFIDVSKSVSFSCLVLEEPLVLDSIEITSLPTKLEYFLGDNFESDGIEVTAHYTNGFSQDVTDKVTYINSDLKNTGTQTVKVDYTEKGVTRETGFDIKINAVELSSIELTALPNVTSFFVGSEFNPDGIVVSAVYNNGSRADVTTLAELSGYDMNKSGTQTVLVSYTENSILKTTSYSINVNLPVLMGIEIKTEPSQKSFWVGDTFTAPSIEVTASYNNGAGKDVSSLVSFSGYDMNKTGEQKVTVSYSENGVTQTAQYTITVKSLVLSRIEIKKEPQKVFCVNDEFSAEGIEVTAVYENGAIKDVSSLVSFSGYDMEFAGSQNVIVSYTENGVTKTASYEITLNYIRLTGIVVDCVPTAVQYQNLPFNSQGLKVTANYNNGDTKDVSASAVVSGYDKTKFGEQTLTVSYTEDSVSESATFKVNVIRQVPSSASLISAPQKTEYLFGENFNSSGTSVKITYNNALTKTVSASSLSFSGYDMNKVGEQSVTASFEEASVTKSVSFNINVINFETGLSLTSAPSKTEYYIGASGLDLSGLSVSADMADGTEVHLNNNDLSVLSLPDFSTLGEKVVTLEYESAVTSQKFTVNFSINVVPWLISLEVIHLPQKTEYYYGETFSSSGLSVKAHYADGTAKDVTSSVALSGYDMNNCSEQSVKVSYNEKTESVGTAFNIKVKNYELSVYVKTAPDKQVYYLGEALDLTGLCVMARMVDGTEKDVTANINHSQFSASSAGSKTVTVFYTSEKGSMLLSSFSLSVKASVSSLSVVSYPQKSNYYLGDELDLTGLVLSAVMDDGSIVQIGKDDVSVSGFDNTTASNQTLLLTYTCGKSSASAQLIVSVAEKDYITSVSVKTLPNKQVYNVGESFNSTGLVVTANYKSGSQVVLTSAQYTLSGFDSSSAGEKTVLVKYTVDSKDFTTSFKVSVNESALSRCDIDLNGSVDVADVAIVLLQLNYGKSSLTADNKRCDVDLDGSVGVSDISQILLQGHYGESV